MTAPHDPTPPASPQASEPRVKPGSQAEARQIRRGSNWVNMVIALAACMVVVVFAIMMAPKGDYTSERKVDVKEAASQAKSGVDFTLYIPSLPSGWKANEAGKTQMGDPVEDTWYVSMHGPNDAWVTVRQAAADQRWAQSLEDDAIEVGAQEAGGTKFTRYETSKGKQMLTAEVGKTQLALVGTATWDDFGIFAKQAVNQFKG